MTKLKKATAIFVAVAILLTTTVFCYANGYDTVKVSSSADYRLNYSGDANYSVKNGTYTKGQNTYGAKVYTVEASPKSSKIMVTGGSSVYSKATLTDLIAQTDKGNSRVITAINADFFSTATGIPLGLQITNGRIVTTNAASYGGAAVGFKADGSTVFGTPEYEISLTVDDFTVKADKVNRQNNFNNHIILFTSDFGDKTYWGTNEKGTGYDVIVLETDKALKVDSKIQCYFHSFLQNVKDPVTIEKDKMYLCAPTGLLNGFKVPLYQELGGEIVYMDESFITVTEKTGKWNGVINAVGGGNMLINGGVIRYPSTYDSSIKNTYTSRTAFGVKADGTYVFYAAERNKDAGVSGIWMDAVAQAMYNMGCVYAINLDGGGSTTVITDTGSGASVQNKCQDGSQRKIANAILLLSDDFAPEIIEDFESEKKLSEIYDGTNLLTASVVKQNAYTGTGALKLDYSLRGIGNSVGAEFAPIDVTKYKMLSVAVDSVKSGVIIEARLKNGKKEFVRTVSSSSANGYSRYQVDVSDATELVGFNVTYKLSAKNRNTVYIDRIVGLGGDMSTETTAPTVTITKKDGKINVSATEPIFSAGVDKGGAEITVDGGNLIRANSLDTALYSNDKVHKARIDVTDTLGNRAVNYQLFKTAKYSSPTPFADMNDTKWDALALRYCYENGIINGIKENGTLNFKGANNITRAEFCVMIVNRKKLDVNSYVGVKLPYTDADSIPKWALLYVKAAYAEGIMTGSKTKDGVVFSPNADITRAEVASALDRLIVKDLRLKPASKYTDASSFAKWAKPYIESTTAQGLFMGDKDGKFLPKKNLSRSESAVLMSKL